MVKKLTKKNSTPKSKKPYFYLIAIIIVSIVVTVIMTVQAQTSQTFSSNAQEAFPTAGILGPGPEGGGTVQQSSACSNGQCITCTDAPCSIQCTGDQCTCTGGTCQAGVAPSAQPTSSGQPGISTQPTSQPTAMPQVTQPGQAARGNNNVNANSMSCANGQCVTCSGGQCSIQCTDGQCTCTGGACQASASEQNGISQQDGQASQAGQSQGTGVSLIQQLTDLIAGFLAQIKAAFAALFTS